MDLAQFIELLKAVPALLWVIFAFWVIYVMKDPLISKIPFVKKVKVSGIELEFEKKIDEITADAKVTFSGVHPEVDLLATIPDHYIELAEISPTSTILVAWHELQSTALSIAIDYNVELDPHKIKSASYLGEVLSKAQILGPRRTSLFHRLRALRNFAAHQKNSEQFDSASALKYAGLAEEFITLFNNYRKRVIYTPSIRAKALEKLIPFGVDIEDLLNKGDYTKAEEIAKAICQPQVEMSAFLQSRNVRFCIF